MLSDKIFELFEKRINYLSENKKSSKIFFVNLTSNSKTNIEQINFEKIVQLNSKNTSATSEKKCTLNGTWNKNRGAEWTNYTDCYDHSVRIFKVISTELCEKFIH